MASKMGEHLSLNFVLNGSRLKKSSVVGSDRDCSFLYCLFTICTVDGRFSPAEYSQEIMVKFAFVSKPQLIRVHREFTLELWQDKINLCQ